MAYHNGVWESDRETRKRNEAMWQNTGGSGKRHKDAKHKGRDHDRAPGREDDLSRAIEAEKALSVSQSTGTMVPASQRAAGLMPPAGSWQGGQGGTRVDRPLIPGGCTHNGGKLSMTLSNGKRLYASRAYDLKDAGHLDLIVDCAGLLQGKRFVKSATAPRYRSLNVAAWPDVITLAWPDMTAPTQVGIRFWARLRDLLPGATAVCCMGAHGRTGTALAALLVADGETGQGAIDRVRKEHCARAIETKEQEAYILGLARERDRVKGGR